MYFLWLPEEGSSYHLIYCPDATTNSGYLLRNAISVLIDIVVRHLPTAYPPYYTLTDCIPEQLPISCVVQVHNYYYAIAQKMVAHALN